MKVYTLREVKRLRARDSGTPDRFIAYSDHVTIDIGYGLALTTQPDAIEYVQECNCTAHLTTDERTAHAQRPCPHHGGYTYALYGATRCNGGYVIYRFTYPKQRDTIRCHVFDELRAQFVGHYGPAGTFQLRTAIALERLAAIRDRLLAPAVTA